MFWCAFVCLFCVRVELAKLQRVLSSSHGLCHEQLQPLAGVALWCVDTRSPTWPTHTHIHIHVCAKTHANTHTCMCKNTHTHKHTYMSAGPKRTPLGIPTGEPQRASRHLIIKMHRHPHVDTQTHDRHACTAAAVQGVLMLPGGTSKNSIQILVTH